MTERDVLVVVVAFVVDVNGSERERTEMNTFEVEYVIPKIS